MMITYGQLVLRLVVSTICGIAIGYERTSRNKEAGLRTHAIVALSSCLMMLISKYGFSDLPNYDGSRVASQIVSGIGFIGAGLIFVKNNNAVSGLTTAAGIWGTAGVGMAIGSGQFAFGIVATGLIVFVQIFFHKETFFTKSQWHKFTIFLKLKNIDTYLEIKNILQKHNMLIDGINITKKENDQVDIQLDFLTQNAYDRFGVLVEITKNQDVMYAYFI